MSVIRAAAAALAMVLLLGGGAATAQERDRGDQGGYRGDQGYRVDERDRRPEPPRERYYRRPPPRAVWGYDAPAYVQAPPPMVYAPPPPPEAIFGFSLNLR
jgi:hypothetical protein